MTERVITVADAAITHLKELKAKQGVDHLWLRMGVRSGGCSVRWRCCCAAHELWSGERARKEGRVSCCGGKRLATTSHTRPTSRIRPRHASTFDEQGMSYVLDVMNPEEITAEDHVEKYEQHGFSCVVDPQSMLYLFGLQLDYKDALIGGGFQFMVRVLGCVRTGPAGCDGMMTVMVDRFPLTRAQNPNSAETCGCGKSFGI